MAYASITYTSASGTTFALTNSEGDPIPYLRQADITVTVNGTVLTQGTGYTFNAAGTAVVLASAVSGATVIISRSTSIADATVVYTAGSTLTAQDLNNADNQIRYGLQEFSDTYAALTTGTGDLQALGGFIGSSETWVSDNAHAATTGAIDGRVDSKIDTALTTDVVAGNAITITDNSPSSGQITVAVTNGAIETAELADGAVTTAKIVDSNVTTVKIADSNVTTAKIADANVTTAKIADSAVTSAKIADGTIVAGDLASDSVTTAKILDANVTTAKIADSNVTTAKLADSSVTSAKIADGTIVAGDLASDSVTTAKILDANVTTAKIADSNVTTGKIADSAVTAIKIADGVITSAKLNASTVVTAAEQSASTPDDTSFFTTSASDNRYDARYVNVTGDTMSGALAMGNNKITGLGTPTANADAATKLYVDNSVAAGVGDADYGDITVSGTGTVWTIDNGVVTSAKLGSDLTVDLASGSAATPSLTFDANTGLYSPGADQVAISTNGTGRLFIDSSGRLLVGTSTGYLTSTSTVTQPLFQVHNTNANEAQVSINSWATGTNTGGNLTFCRSDSGAVGTHTVIGVADALGNIRFAGSDGTKFIEGASITASADGTWGADDGPSKLVFSTTADGASSPTERMRINSSGNVGIGTTSPNSILTTKGSFITVQNSSGSNVGFIGTADNVISGGSSTDFGISTSGGSLLFGSGGTTQRVTIDSSGRLLVGTSSAIAALEPSIQTARSSGAFLALGRDDTSITDDETLGAIYFYGNQGSSWSNSARIEAKADAAWGTNDYPSKLVFFTCPDSSATPVERMRISNIGTTSFFGAQDVIYSRTAASAGTTYATFAGVYSATGTGVGGTVSFVVWSNGNVVNTNNSYGSLSDIKLKENIADASPQWDDIKALQIRKYNFKEGQTHTQIGLIAQEVELISPGLVTESPDRDAEGNDLGTVTKSVNYSVLYMKAVKALQEAMERIEQLEAKVAALESA